MKSLEEIINDIWIKSDKAFNKDKLFNEIIEFFLNQFSMFQENCILKKNFVLKKTIIKTPFDLVEFLCNNYNIKIQQLLSKTRKGEIVKIRQIYCFLAVQYWKERGYNLSRLGLYVGYDQTGTIRKAIKAIQDKIYIDEKFKLEIENIQKQIIIKI